jgi:hypothetical protein
MTEGLIRRCPRVKRSRINGALTQLGNRNIPCWNVCPHGSNEFTNDTTILRLESCKSVTTSEDSQGVYILPIMSHQRHHDIEIGESPELDMESGRNKELGIEVVTVLVYTDSSLVAITKFSAW